MKRICAALGDKRNLRAGTSTGIGGAVGGGHPELLGRIERRAQYAGKFCAVQLIVVIHAVERDVALVRPSPAHRAAAAIDGVVFARISEVENAGLKRKQRQGVAALHRKRLNHRVIHRVAQDRVRSVQGLSLAAYIHRHRAGLNRKRKINGRWLIDQQFGLLNLISKTHGRAGDDVSCRRNLREHVRSTTVRNSPEGRSIGRVHKRDPCSGNQRAAGILDHAAQRCGGSLAEGEGEGGKKAQKQPSRLGSFHGNASEKSS